MPGTPWSGTTGELRQRLAEAGATEIRVVHYGWPLGYLLDTVRDRWAGGPVGHTVEGGTAEERTSTSGRILQPNGAVAGGVIRMAVSPFAVLQRMRPDRGPGLVAVAVRPE